MANKYFPKYSTHFSLCKELSLQNWKLNEKLYSESSPKRYFYDHESIIRRGMTCKKNDFKKFIEFDVT